MIDWGKYRTNGKVKAQHLNRLVSLIQSLALQPGRGYFLNRSNAGTTLVVDPGGSGAPSHPFKISKSQDGEAFYAHLGVGTINDVLPLDIFESKEISDSGTYYIYLDVTVSVTEAKITEVVWVASTTHPSVESNTHKDTPPSSFKVLIGIIKDWKIYQVVNTNLYYAPVVIWYETKIPSEPGEESFSRWYEWVGATIY